MVTKKPVLGQLSANSPFTTKDGKPTPEFIRLWQQRDAQTGKIPYDAASTSALLDYIASTTGSILVRGIAQWGGLLAPNDATTFLNGAIPPAFAAVKDTDLALSDVTGNDVSAARHGFAPKLPNDATKYLDGTGHYTVPPDTDPILGTAVPSAVEPAGWLYSRSGALELYQSNPTTTPPLAIVQHASAINGSGTPGAITLVAPPTAGNLIVVFLHCNTLAATVTKNTIGWTEFESVISSTSQVGSGVYRYAQAGDTATLPALWTAGTTFWAYDVYEISGVSGTFATDALGHVQSTTATPTTNVTSLASGTIATTLPNALALVGAGQYNGNADPTLSVGWTRDEFGHNNTNYGSDVAGHQAVVASGTGVSATATFTTSSAPADLILLVLQAPTITAAHWDLIANASFGTVTSVGLALPSIFTVSGSPVTDAGMLTGVLATQTANLIWGGPASGAAAAPTFRKLVASDFGNHTANTVLVGPATGAAAAPTFRALVAADIPALTYVTSVGLALPASIFTVSGSPVTSAGTLTGALNTQLAGQVWAGPVSGAAAAPTFRTLADTEITGTTTGAIPFVSSGLLAEDGVNLFWDGTNKRLGIGTNVPDSALTISLNTTKTVPGTLPAGVVAHFVGANATTTRFLFDHFGVNSNAFLFRTASGSAAAPTATAINITLGKFAFVGYTGTDWSNSTGAAQVSAVTAEAFTATANGTSIRFLTTPLGSITAAEVARFESNTGFSMFGANPVIDQNLCHVLHGFTVATLPTPSGTATKMPTAFVSDATLGIAAGLGLAPIGGGANRVPVYDDAVWKIG